MKIIIVITVPDSDAGFIDGVVRSGVAFLEAGGAKIRMETHSGYLRVGRRGHGMEALTLLTCAVPDDAANVPSGRQLETVLRSTLSMLGEGDVRVFVLPLGLADGVCGPREGVSEEN